MKIHKNKKGVSGSVMKVGAAMLIALAVFMIFLSFSFATEHADQEISEMGQDVINYTHKTPFRILEYE